jgi:hypothetical protein
MERAGLLLPATITTTTLSSQTANRVLVRTPAWRFLRAQGRPFFPRCVVAVFLHFASTAIRTRLCGTIPPRSSSAPSTESPTLIDSPSSASPTPARSRPRVRPPPRPPHLVPGAAAFPEGGLSRAAASTTTKILRQANSGYHYHYTCVLPSHTVVLPFRIKSLCPNVAIGQVTECCFLRDFAWWRDAARFEEGRPS